MSTKNIKLEVGTVYRKKDGGSYFFRYQVNGQRKALSLHTKNQKEAIQKAEEMIPTLKAPSVEVVAAHISHARNWTKKTRKLELSHAWSVYDKHPERANPSTVNIYQRYESYFGDFVEWATQQGHRFLDEITDRVVDEYVKALQDSGIGVDTHNKRIARVGHVFRTLSDYTTDDTSDWNNRRFRRKPREEIGIAARRLPFTREQEEQLFAVLADPTKQCKNKAEIRVLFYLGAFTGQRLKDCALLQWHKVDLTRQRIRISQFKTGKAVVIPIAPVLRDILKEAEQWSDGNYVLPKIATRYHKKDKHGRDTGPSYVNHDVIRVIKWIGVEPSIKVPGRQKAVTVYGFHSLRHSFVSFCIDNNIPKAVAVSILGADSDIIDQYYTHIGEEAQERAIQLISGNGTSLKQRHEKALEFLAQLPANERTDALVEVEKILRG